MLSHFVNMQQVICFGSGVAFLAMLIILLHIPDPQGREWEHFRLSRRYMLLAYVILFLLEIVEILLPVGGDPSEPAVTIFVAFYQALLFTVLSLVFIRPLENFRTRFLVYLGCVTVVNALMLPLFFIVSQSLMFPLLVLYALLYVSACIHYTVVFVREYKECVKKLERFYAEDMQYRLEWVRWFFFMALGMGIVALISAFYMPVMPFFILFYTIFYAYSLACIVRYQVSSGFLMKAASGRVEKAEEPVVNEPRSSVLDERLSASLDAWIERKGYCESDKAVDEITRELGTSYSALNQYLATRYNTTFSKWRIDLRMKEAHRLLTECPELTVMEVLYKVGYNDRTNFYRHFRRAYGCSPSDLREDKH